MYHYYVYHHGNQPCMIFDPPIVFEAPHCYNTRCKDSFANLATCGLTTIKQYLRSPAQFFMVENSLFDFVPVDFTYTSFVLSVRNYYYNVCFVMCSYYSSIYVLFVLYGCVVVLL